MLPVKSRNEALRAYTKPYKRELRLIIIIIIIIIMDISNQTLRAQKKK